IMKFIFLSALMLAATSLASQEYLVRFNANDPSAAQSFIQRHPGQFELVSLEQNLYKWTTDTNATDAWDSSVSYIQPDHKIHIFESPSLGAARAKLIAALDLQKKKHAPSDSPPDESNKTSYPYPDNPDFQTA